MKKRVLVFASGTKDSGGSGFENLVKVSRKENLDFEVIAVVSNHENGGVRKKADGLLVPFVFMEKPFTSENYQEIFSKWNPDFVCLSGWLKLVSGLPAEKTINIHPGPLPNFGGNGMYGHFVHEAVIESYKNGGTKESAVTMHFVTEKYDEGPIFFICRVPILPYDTAETLGKRVNEAEHKWQPIITEKVANGEISWNGKNPESLTKKIEV